MLTQQFLDDLITCKKVVSKVERKKMVHENRHYKNTATLSSIDNKYTFSMFIRVSDEFKEDFSVGLIWTNPNEFIGISSNIILLRCQGPHDGKKPENFDIHHSFHIHKISVNDIEEKRYKKPSNRFSVEDFSSFEEAAWYFAEHCNIIDIEKHLGYPFNLTQLKGQMMLH